MSESAAIPASDDTDLNKERAGPMAIEAPSSNSISMWPDRLRHSAIILLAAGLALAVLVTFGELSPVRAPAFFVCLASAARVPWRLHNVATSREDVRGVNPVETAAVSAVVAGMPDPAVLLDRAGRVIHLNSAAAQLAPALRKNELAQFALRSPEIISALREAIATTDNRGAPEHDPRAARSDRTHRNQARALSRSRAGRSLDGIDHHAGAGADPVRRHREMHADDVPRSDAAAPGRGNARRLRRQCQS